MAVLINIFHGRISRGIAICVCTSTEVCTKSPAHALAIALALVSESGPKMICGALSEVQAQSLGWCRTFGADLLTCISRYVI